MIAIEQLHECFWLFEPKHWNQLWRTHPHIIMRYKWNYLMYQHCAWPNLCRYFCYILKTHRCVWDQLLSTAFIAVFLGLQWLFFILLCAMITKNSPKFPNPTLADYIMSSPVKLCEYIFTILSSFLMTAAVIRPDMAPICTVARSRAGSRLPAVKYNKVMLGTVAITR